MPFGRDWRRLGGVDHPLVQALPKLARAVTSLHERPGQTWSLEAMALAAGLSRSAFAAEFKASTGTPPGEHLLRWRISIAQTMLRDGASVKTIRDALGYTSPAAFSRGFSQIVGASPRAWLPMAEPLDRAQTSS